LCLLDKKCVNAGAGATNQTPLKKQS